MSLSAPKKIDLPNLAEYSMGDLWRMHQENDDARAFHAAHQAHARKEILERSVRENQTLFTVDGGEVEIFPSNSYTYKSLIVTGDFSALCSDNGLGDAYEENVTHVFKIKRPWLNKLMKRGQKFVDIIEQMTDHSTGSPKIQGPSLQDIGGYAEGVGE